MNYTTAFKAIERLPHKQYLSLREVWKDLRLFSHVVTAAGKLKLVPDSLDNVDLNDLKKAKVSHPKNIKTVVTKPVAPPKKSTPTKPKTGTTDQPSKNEKQVPVVKIKTPDEDKAVDDFENLAPTFNAPTTDVTSRPNIPTEIDFGSADRNQLSAANETLHKLYHQRELISNIVNTLQSGFANISNETPDSISKAVKYAQNIEKTVKEQIASTRTALSTATKTMLPPEFVKLVGLVLANAKNRINTSTKHKVDVSFSCGANENGAFQLTAFLIFHNVELNHGITPLWVVAISLLGQHYYINPALMRVPAVGKFRIGYQLPNTDKMARIAKRYIDEQFAFSDNLDAINTVPVPPHLEGMDLQNIQNVQAVNFLDDGIEFTFKSNIRNEQAASEVANNIFIILSNAMYMYDSHAKIKPRLAIAQNDNQWVALVKFSKQDSISGRALGRDEIAYLQKIFTDSDIKQIRYVLSKIQASNTEELSFPTKKHHGHVTPIKGGKIKAKCGGPGKCPVCNEEWKVKYKDSYPSKKVA